MAGLGFDAVIFDLDGVVTQTAHIHSAAWKQMFDEFLHAHSRRSSEPFREFTHNEDYLPYVDGKPRYQGVASFLESRGIGLPYGDPSDPPDRETICGLGNRKNALFNERIARGEVEVYTTTVDFIRVLRGHGIRVGVATSSKNGRAVLEATGLLSLFETCVDGNVSEQFNLKGKPDPDIFTTACDQLAAPYDRAVVVEDAVSGVQAGARGNFGLVLGVARGGNKHALRGNGADIVVNDLSEIGIDELKDWFETGLAQDGWGLTFFDYEPEEEGTREALSVVGNGYMGTRGALELCDANEINYPGTYIAGVYNQLESEVAGRVIVNEDFVNCPNWLPLTFRVGNGNWADPNRGTVLDFTRRLDFHQGVLSSDLLLRDETGRETRIQSRRFASMADPHLVALQWTLTPLNYHGKLTFLSRLDGRVVNAGVKRYRQLNSKHLEAMVEGGGGEYSHLMVCTSQSRLKIAVAARLQVALDDRLVEPAFNVETEPGCTHSTFTLEVEAGARVVVEKLVAIYTSRDESIEKPLDAARHAVRKLENFEKLCATSASVWSGIWDKIDIQVEGDRFAQKILRLSLYHTFVTTSPHNACIDAGIPARGLHGEAYRGHIFWDEMYVLPVYMFHFPEVAKSVLMYRYRRLDAARAYARQHGHKGAMFPWQSGSEGREETQIIHLNPLSGQWGPDYSSLQRHVSLAIAYNIWSYYWITEDVDFLERYGAEMILDICCFWASKAILDRKSKRYSIVGVMGPDEYHERYPDVEYGGLRDNGYTNLMVIWTFERAFEMLKLLGDSVKKALMKKLKLKRSDLARWESICTHMRIPISKEGILEQFDGYFQLQELDWDAYREKFNDIHRMDRILKAEGKSPDDYKVSKQADALMAFYVLEPEGVEEVLGKAGYEAGANALAKNFAYYYPRTSHGSTLSKLVHSYLAHLLEERVLSWRLYMDALKSDYVDIQGGTTKEGIHTGVMAGTAILTLKNFAGLRFDEGQLHLNPALPQSWRKLRFNLVFKGDRYAFEISSDKASAYVDSPQGRRIAVFVQQRRVNLENKTWTILM